MSADRPSSETGFHLSDYDYVLPQDRIASEPLKERAAAKLLRVNRQSGGLSHHTFSDIGAFLKPGDVLVLNNTKVIPARLLGVRDGTGGKIEMLLLRKIEGLRWEALLRPSGRLPEGSEVHFSQGDTLLKARLMDAPREGSGMREVLFLDDDAHDKIWQLGHIPLPPYIERSDTPADREMYQTVFAAHEGAVAAPTAGLHFDQPLLEKLASQGVEIIYITLHTGYGTFQPVSAEDVRQHKMFFESYHIDQTAAEALNRARDEGRRIVACGTTSVRTLESAVSEDGRIRAGSGETDIFIYPTFQFRVVDGLITNFHLPKSTLLMLVSAFAGYERIMAAYREAIQHGYRFYSYGDAMVIL